MRIDYQIEGSFALITRLIDYAELWFVSEVLSQAAKRVIRQMRSS
jgi:hypothetical protein